MRIKRGTVISTKMDKTIVVSVDIYKNHPKYHKKYRVTKKYHVHCEDPKIKAGDEVTFKETRPLSKSKNWVIINTTKEEHDTSPNAA